MPQKKQKPKAPNSNHKAKGYTIKVGRIERPHGVKGGVWVHSYTNPPEALCSYPLLWNSGRPAPSIWACHKKATRLMCIVDAVKTRSEAEKITGHDLYVNRSALALIKEEKDFYINDLIGIAVADQKETLGVVTHVNNHNAGDFFDIRLIDGRCATLPFHAQAVSHVDLKRGCMKINCSFLMA